MVVNKVKKFYRRARRTFGKKYITTYHVAYRDDNGNVVRTQPHDNNKDAQKMKKYFKRHNFGSGQKVVRGRVLY